MKLLPFGGILLVAAFSVAAASMLKDEPVPGTAYQVFAGGVAGVEALAVSNNSQWFRNAGGGLYLHNSGWGRLTPVQRKEVLTVFKKASVAIELGFGANSNRAAAWAQACRRLYLDLGIKPVFIAANAFADNHHPTPTEWLSYVAALRAAGVPAQTLILPTFEYQNFRQNLVTLAQHLVSHQPEFQSIIRNSGGLVLDVPPGYFFTREKAYRQWILDALGWTRKHGLTTVIIVSPYTSGKAFRADTRRFLKYLQEHRAVPGIFVVENYAPRAPADYPNPVGNEHRPNTILGVARWLQQAPYHPPP